MSEVRKVVGAQVVSFAVARRRRKAVLSMFVQRANAPGSPWGPPDHVCAYRAGACSSPVEYIIWPEGATTAWGYCARHLENRLRYRLSAPDSEYATAADKEAERRERLTRFRERNRRRAAHTGCGYGSSLDDDGLCRRPVVEGEGVNALCAVHVGVRKRTATMRARKRAKQLADPVYQARLARREAAYAAYVARNRPQEALPHG